uniref:Uncharacterized protein MANES_15G018900 n=1 Tax=Rhizophora mucronata TaxID=61149 RepID=A0A2P2NZ76_RHIMU
MAIHPRIVFAKLKLLSHLLSTLPLDVEKSSPSSRDQPDEHESLLLLVTHSLSIFFFFSFFFFFA